MIFGINNVGEYGIIRDKQPHEIPPNAWSSGQNVRFVDGFASKVNGYSAVFGTPTIGAYALMPVPQTGSYLWMQMGAAKVYAWDGSTHTNITRQTASVDVDYTGGVTGVWTGCVLSGVPVICNGVDTPQMWNPTSVSQKLQELSNWPANTTAKVIRAYKQYLLALNVTKSGVNYTSMLKWSHPADPNTVPTSWDETDPTLDAGEYVFSESGDFIVDCLPMRDFNIVYKEEGTYAQQFVGGVGIFRFSKLFGSFGLVSPDCAVEFLQGKHLVFGFEDIVIHDGQSAQSILSEKMRRWLYNTINIDAKDKFFVAVNAPREEVIIAFCTDENTLPDMALLWNWRTGVLGIRNLPLASAIVPGIVDIAATSDTWSTDTDTWDSDSEPWGTRLYSPAARGMLMAIPAGPSLQKLDTTTQEDGTNMTAILERTGLSVPFAQQLLPDFTARKMLRGIWPRFEGSKGVEITVELGTQQEIGGDVTWKVSKTFIIGTTKKVDCLISGRLFAVRFTSTAAVSWTLHGYELDIVFTGGY